MGWLQWLPGWRGSDSIPLLFLVCLVTKAASDSDGIVLLGKGACRGAGWQDGIWPIDEGRRTTDECAGICKSTKGCVAFDISNKEGEKYNCMLLGHPNIYPATALKAECYMVKGAKVDPETRKTAPKSAPAGKNVGGKDPRWEDPATRPQAAGEKKKPSVASSKVKDPRWEDPATREPAAGEGKKTADKKTSKPVQDPRWEDPRTREPAAGEVKKTAAKTTAQTTKDPRWEDPATREPAAGEVKSAAKSGNQAVKDPRWEDPATREPAAGEAKKAAKTATKVKDPRWEDPATREPAAGEMKTAKASPAKTQGTKDPRWEDPATRAPAAGETKKTASAKKGVQDPRWEDPATREPAAGEVKKAGAASKQGVQDPRWENPATREPAAGEKRTVQAKSAGGKDPRWEDPATRAPAAGERRQGPPAPSKKIDDIYPAGGAGYARLGSGRCRGQNWQDGKWPQLGGSQTAADCAAKCRALVGCKAFDLACGEGKKFTCTFYGHRNIVPTGASQSMSGACYSISDSLAEEEEEVEENAGEEEDMIIDMEGDVDVALLGKGGCRGGGWQDGGWPKTRGFISLDDCGRQCLAVEGCTAFHAAAAKEGSKDEFECFLFGHKSVVAARGLVGNCYTVSRGSAKTIRSKPSAAAPQQKKKKTYKIPEFEQPKVVDDVYEAEDDEWLFEPPPPEIRSRDHITQILALEEPAHDGVLKVTETTLKELKKVYEHSIKDLEKAYKYRELSHRHFGDPEMFNKPLIVLMGPWSGGKSTMINYLLGNEYTANAFKTSAEPSQGFNFNIAMYGEEVEDLDGTEIAAEWAFSSLQKFGQEFLKKLKGKKMPNKLLEKATFAEIPGVLETGTIRKIDRRYPFNDACQWFIDHADLIVLVYDYAKLDIGPETEALLDQLKGRESQVRIVLNKADEITAEELLKIQGNLVWNVSPLMASVEPPTLYAGSFWSKPYQAGAPKRLLKAQEQALIKDIKDAIDKRVENRISTARRFAVRVRNHAKMVDCYLTTYLNNKGMFGDKKKVADDIINNPSKYHIYEGLSTLTNISRYDLPDPDTYRDFFNVHPLYDFPSLQSTCTFFKGCPLNKLDISIAYELPEILTGYKRKVKLALNPPKAEIPAPKNMKK